MLIPPHPINSSQLRTKIFTPSMPFPPPPTHMISSSLSPLLTNTNLRRRDLYTPQPTVSSPHPSKPTPPQLVGAPAMASALFSAPTFQGLRPLKPTDSARAAAAAPRLVAVAPRRARGGCRAELSAPLVISLSTGLSLFLGRFVFFNFQRENVAKQLPKQNGISHFEAGDVRAKEYEGLLKSNDPVGFNIVDVLAWGSIGHIVAYYILATSSNGYDPKFFS